MLRPSSQKVALSKWLERVAKQVNLSLIVFQPKVFFEYVEMLILS